MPLRRGRAALVGVLATATRAATAPTGPTASATRTSFTATADTSTDGRDPADDPGGARRLGVDGDPPTRTVLRFDVASLAGPVTRAKLRIHVADADGAGNVNGGEVRGVSDTSWTETSAAPAVDGPVLGALGAVAPGTWHEVDVTPYVTGNGTYAFGVTSPNGDGADYDSRETGATGPQLVVETAAAPAPSRTPAPSEPAPTPPSPAARTAQDLAPVLVGAGDIAASNDGDSATADLLDGISGTVFTVGDNAYPTGRASDFAAYYAPTWGRQRDRTRPSPGNHDYDTPGASAYFDYFGAAAGPGRRGYYSYDLGNWHVVSLDSEISMARGSAQEKWLRADLAASEKPCTVAYWHRPRWTSGASHPPDLATDPLVRALYDHGAEVILGGHNHQYERFAPQDPDGRLDTARGLKQFVVGMGGADHYAFGTVLPHSEARNDDTSGVLKLTLRADGYDWQFVPEAGRSYDDSGSGTCH
ncbi:DNRLRE domain-containing protein [Streptomyces sp. NPDC048330]|uniref:CBM96 family carbohydrate-binding protein n=1 Tax=Streptomyces sp. NPDC048330 TaxID=3365533 RepID=UPI00371B98D8